MARETELVERVAEELRRADIPFRQEVAVGGVTPDFVVQAPDGRVMVVEVKAWQKAPGFRNRAAHQVGLMKEALDADLALVVIDTLERSDVAEGVVTVDRLVPVLQEELARSARRPSGRVMVPTRPRRHVFAAMPFDQRYDDTYYVAMVPAVKAVNAVCKRVDGEEFAGDIVAEIQKLIRGSVAVIVDLSEANPNVLYEAGFAHGLRKPTIHVCSTPLSELPFDVAHWNTITYHAGRTHLLKDPLARRLQATLG
jgi:hypothetical protein